MIEVRLGLRNALRLGASVHPIVRERGAWHRIEGLPGGSRRVRYELFRDRFHIESDGARLVVQFRLRNSGFTWQGKRYLIRSMILFKPLGRGAVLVAQGDRLVVKGSLAFTGVRLEEIAPELAPISAELALGLALRGQAYLDALSGTGSNFGFAYVP